jgi:hypothetical protein
VNGPVVSGIPKALKLALKPQGLKSGALMNRMDLFVLKYHCVADHTSVSSSFKELMK